VDRVLPGAREVGYRTEDGLDLRAWYRPAVGPNRATALFAPGNGGDRSLRAPLAAALAEHGIATLLVDYRGYGGNPGSPSSAGLARDVRAARRYLLDELRAAPHRLFYLGESLGCAVVVELATEHPPAGLLLRSPFVSLASVARVHYPFIPVGALLPDRYPVAARLSRVTVPTTVIYGGADAVVPPAQSRAVARAAGGPVSVVEVPGADHNDPVFLDGQPMLEAVRALVEKAASS
jgi:pimeloyl-ACP methyl ester carboxylesterase